MFRLNRCVSAVAAVAMAAAVSGVAPGAVAASSTPNPGRHVRVVTFEPAGAVFAESLAATRDGVLYASTTTFGDTNTGQVVRIARDGSAKPFGPPLALGVYGVLTGLAFDAAGRLYVAMASFDETLGAGVFRVTPSALLRVATLPAEAMPNGLAVRDRWLYASDSLLGVIWRVPLTGSTTTDVPWLASPLLAPGTEEGLGANGIAFRGADLYVAVADSGPGTGALLRVPVKRDGKPGVVRLITSRPELSTADGIAFDPQGHLWVAVNGQYDAEWTVPPTGQRLIRIDVAGNLERVVTDAPWMNYPTQPVFVDGSCRLFLANGAYGGGDATVVALPAQC